MDNDENEITTEAKIEIRLQRIEAKLDRALHPEPPLPEVRQMMALTRAYRCLEMEYTLLGLRNIVQQLDKLGYQIASKV